MFVDDVLYTGRTTVRAAINDPFDYDRSTAVDVPTGATFVLARDDAQFPLRVEAHTA